MAEKLTDNARAIRVTGQAGHFGEKSRHQHWRGSGVGAEKFADNIGPIRAAGQLGNTSYIRDPRLWARGRVGLQESGNLLSAARNL
eukprot:s3835_g11.t1